MSEPTLASVHADLVGRLEQDKRLRAVEQQVASLSSLPAELVRMEDRIMHGLADAKAAAENARAKPWPAVSALAAAVALLLIVAERLYS